MTFNTFVGGNNAIASEVNNNFTELRNQLYLSFTGSEQLSISATQTTSSASYSTKKKYHLLHNSGSNPVYINFEAAATTNSFKLDAGERREIPGVVSAVHAICDTGLTTTVRVLGFGDSTDSTTLSVYFTSCTDTNTSVALAASTRWFCIKNTGTNNVYINIDGAATTSKYIIEPGASISIGKISASTLQFICDSGKTSTIRIIGSTEF